MTELATVTGVADITKIADVKIPSIQGVKEALIAPNSPNLASMGRLVMDEGYSVMPGHVARTFTRLVLSVKGRWQASANLA